MRRVVAAIAAFVVLLSAQSALADRRVALVIGNSDYKFVAPVPTAAADARLLAARLSGSGFQVLVEIDLTREQMAARLREFGARTVGADVALLFYSGHAVAVQGTNYLLPIDANPESALHLALESIDLARAVDIMADAKTRLAFVDAGSGNPLPAKFRASPTRSGPQRGLERMSAAAGTLIAFAASPGETAVALDGAGNSPFAQALAASVAEPGVEIQQAMRKVRSHVSEQTGQRQLPWVNSALIGTVYLKGNTVEPPPAPPPPPPVADNSDAIKRAEEERRRLLAEQERSRLEASQELTTAERERRVAEERARRALDEAIVAALRIQRETRNVPSQPSATPAPAPADPSSAISSLPEFPSPIPAASASYVLPEPLLKQSRTIGDAINTILGALERTGYVERTFFRTKAGGVALVTRLEKIDQNGTPLVEHERWAVADRSYDSAADLMNFFRGLFLADRGRYRLIVFILQETPFVADGKKLSEKEARSLMKRGANVLSTAAAKREFAGHHCTVLIYEFASDGRTVRLVENSRLSGRQHLDKAGVLALIGAPN